MDKRPINIPTTATISMTSMPMENGETGYIPYRIILSDGTTQFYDHEARRNDFTILEPSIGTKIRVHYEVPKDDPKHEVDEIFVLGNIVSNVQENGSQNDLSLYEWDEFVQWQEEIEAYRFTVGSKNRHKGNKKLYKIILDGIKNAEDGLMYTVYKNEEGEIFTRPTWRFIDRFEPVEDESNE